MLTLYNYFFGPALLYRIIVLLMLSSLLSYPVSASTSVIENQTDAQPGASPDELEIVARIYLPVVRNSAQPDGVAQDEDEANAQPDGTPQEEVESEVQASAAQPLEPGVVYEDELAGQATDITLLVQEIGLPKGRVERAIAFQQAFALYADELLARYPNQISAVWTDPLPTLRGHVRFTGNVPAAVAAEVGQRMQRNPALHSVVLTGGGVLSLAKHTRRAELAAEALARQGYQNSVIFFDPVNQMINVELQLPEGTPAPSQVELASVVQGHIQTEQAASAETVDAATLVPLNLELTVLTGSGPIVIDEHSQGGNWLRDDGVRRCTSGWSVRGPNGDGIITAGHCTGLNQFEQPGVAPYSMTFRRQVRGAGGDAEYHTTSHVELPEFYASATAIRSVTSIRTTATMVGNTVCVYGRASNRRTCNHTIQAVGVTVTFSGVRVSNLARTSSSSTTFGDSGGGWSFNNTAYGVHNGRDSSGRGYFTPVQQAQSALGVTIMTR